MIRTFTLAALAFFTAASASLALDTAKSGAPPEAAEPAKPFVYTPKEYDVVEGKADAPVTVVEYASLSCPHCRHFYMEILPEFAKKYIDTGKVRLVFRSYPLNDPALKAAQLVACAAPDSREAFIKVLFTRQEKWAYDPSYRDALGNIALMGGIDKLKFDGCINDDKLKKKVLAVAKEAQDDYKVNATPTFFFGATKYKGNNDIVSFGKAVDDAMAGAMKK